MPLLIDAFRWLHGCFSARLLMLAEIADFRRYDFRRISPIDTFTQRHSRRRQHTHWHFFSFAASRCRRYFQADYCQPLLPPILRAMIDELASAWLIWPALRPHFARSARRSDAARHATSHDARREGCRAAGATVTPPRVRYSRMLPSPSTTPVTYFAADDMTYRQPRLFATTPTIPSCRCPLSLPHRLSDFVTDACSDEQQYTTMSRTHYIEQHHRSCRW